MKYVLLVTLTILTLLGCSKPGTELTEDDFGDKWPLTVSSGYVECKNNAVLFHTRDETYGVNGLAKSRGYPPIDHIWKEDPAFYEMAEAVAEADNISVNEAVKLIGPPTKMNIGPILDRGLELCNRT